MKLINEITNEPRQHHILTLDDGSTMSVNFEYRENQNGWFYSLEHETKSFYNRRIVTSPNMLRQFKNLIPFGLACVTTDGGEPVFINDFSSKRCKFYLLNSDDVQYVEENIINV